MPLLIKIGLVHAQSETIHPCLDDNGRVGRLLITFLLCESVLHKPVLYLSHYFKKHRQTYDELLQSTRDRGAWEDWLAFFLRGVAEVSVGATETARRILTLREQHRNLIAEQLGYAAGNGHRVLERLYERPIMSVNEVSDITGTTYAAANQLVERLVNIGVLSEITGQARNRRFRYDAYMQLFDEAERGERRHDRWPEAVSGDEGFRRAVARASARALEATQVAQLADLRVSNIDKRADEGEFPVRLCNYVEVYKNEIIRFGMSFMRATASHGEIVRFRLRRGDVLQGEAAAEAP
jgi:hypothetical protein